jgi:hypothetical protein
MSFPSLLQSAEDARYGRDTWLTRQECKAINKRLDSWLRMRELTARQRFELSVNDEVRRLIHEATARYERELEMEQV